MSPALLDLEEIRAVRLKMGERVSRTPILKCGWLSDLVGCDIVLKAENLQPTGSFKVRGASAKLARLASSSVDVDGVVAGSAGNHGLAVAYAAREYGFRCVVYMPADAAISKVEAVEAHGGEVMAGGATVDDCVASARDAAARMNYEFVHPFDDRDVLTGQASLGVELLDQVPDLGTVVSPIGGGGLTGASAWAIKQIRPDVKVIGVQVESCAPFLNQGMVGDVHLADGIAVKRPGDLTRELIESHVDQICAVSEDEIAGAMIRLMQSTKVVAEGAGAVGVAALISGAATPAEGKKVVVVLSGGNVDIGVLAAVARRHESVSGRRLHVNTRISDTPGSLAALLSVVAAAKASVVFAEHQRERVDLHVGQTGVDLVLATRGGAHSSRVVEALEAHGYSV